MTAVLPTQPVRTAAAPPPAQSHLTVADMRPVVDQSQELAHTLEQAIQGEVRFDGYSRMLYSTDASLYQIQPVGVVIPRNHDDVQAAVEIAAKHGVPILPRGSGSSLAGQAVGAALVIDFSKYMNDLVGIDPEAKTATVEPGMLVTPLNRTLAPLGLMLGPDPASADRATLGGTVGNNATGSHSILYGMMADHVAAVDAVLGDGSRAHFGPVDVDDLVAKARQDNLEGQIYAKLPQLLRDAQDEIIARWPKHWRRASGYNLDRLLAPLLPYAERSRLSFDSKFRPAICDPQLLDRFNLAQLLTGSEGTLAVVTQVTVNLVPKPKKTALAVVHFDSVIDACAAVPDILETEPSASELLDKQLMDLARAQPEWAKRLHFVQGDPAAVLLTEYYGNDEQELTAKLERLEQHLHQRGWHGAVVRVVENDAMNDVWSVRKAGLNILMSRRSDYKAVPGIEDVSIPQQHLAEYLGKVLDFCYGQGDISDVAVYAHASAGCLHVRPLVNTKTERGVELLQILGNYACDLAVEYGGTMSGEHGDGLARSSFNERLFGSALYQTLRQVKGAFDPDNRMNPGKIVDAPPLHENLRFGPTYQTIELDTVFDWGVDGGYAPAIEMCNGAGVCRKLGAGSMCPSYMATRDERDTTRGRANALRNALAGRIPPAELFSPEMYGVMDLCLGCKACKSECPSAVDMAKIKSEFLVHYYRHNGLPWFNRLMGWLPTLNDLLYKTIVPLIPALIPLINGIMQSAPTKRILEKVGIHPARNLPAYAPESFEQWFNQRKRPAQPVAHPAGQSAGQPAAENSVAPAKTVILFHDTWTNFNETTIGKAAVRVLEAAGYTVHLANGRKCCGRPLITGGQADKARAWVDHNVALLAPYANRGIPIVGLEPSCILTLRDEYLTLAGDTRRAALVAAQALTFEEFIAREAITEGFQSPWPQSAQPANGANGTQPAPKKALLHGHCHQKAIVGNEASVLALQTAGYSVEVIPSGCCGMAGDFGYTRDHYEVSRSVGEDRLFPAVRAAEQDTVLVASGTSCRHQIHDFTQRAGVHIAEALAQALDG